MVNRIVRNRAVLVNWIVRNRAMCKQMTDV